MTDPPQAHSRRSGAGVRRLIIGALALLGIAYFCFPNARLDFTPFNAHDAESYVALASSLVNGRGYTRSFDTDIVIPHAVWPPGLPLLLIPGTYLAGNPIDLLVIKINMIVIGLAGIALSAVYARRVSPSYLASLLVIAGLGLNPYYWHFSRIVMSEVPAYTWLVASLLIIDLTWRGRRPSVALAFGVGVFCGFGMLIRGSVVGLALAPLAGLITADGENVKPSVMLRSWIPFAIGFLVCFSLWALRNAVVDTTGLGYDGHTQLHIIFASDINDPQSARLAPSRVFENALNYVKWSIIYNIPKQTIPGLWIPGFWIWLGALAPFAAASFSLVIVIWALGYRTALPIALVIAPMALLYLISVSGGSPRYWTNTSFLLILAAAIRAGPRLEARGIGAQLSVVACVIVVSIASLSAYIAAHERAPYRDRDYQALAELYGEIAAQHLKLASVYAPNQHAFHIRTGLRSPMAVPGRGIDPYVSHAVIRQDEWKRECLPGRIVLEHSPWLLVELAHQELVSQVKHSFAADCRATE